MNADERSQLIDAVLDRSISEADFLRLEAELIVNPDARNAYYTRLKLHTALERESGSFQPEVAGAERKAIPFRPLLAIAAAVALTASASLVGWLAGNRGDAPNIATKAEPAAAGFAVLAEQSDAEWEHAPQLGRGDLLPQGPLHLRGGTAQLDLFSGVTVIVEGDARFEVVSPMEMAVHQGKVRALVPEPAHGFRITTATGEIVDLGTEFALDVTGDHADLHVLDGEIEWHPVSDAMRHMTKGDTLRWTADGQPAELEAGTDNFAKVEKSLALQRDARREKWLAHAAGLADDPRLLAYFPIHPDTTTKRRLPDTSAAGNHATLVRTDRVPDRWGHPGAALDFTPTGSRARLFVPGTHRALTLACWVKIDSLDRWYNSLFLTDGHELNEPHWQIMDDGRLFFSVKKFPTANADHSDKHIFFSPSFWSPDLSGKWLHLATVYDTAAKTVTHYLDGEPLSTEAIPEKYLVDTIQIGAASIGNWSEPKRDDPTFAVRNLNGSIDEFALFDTALTPDEIADLYQTGSP